jgi:hypothetical protein
VSQGFAETSSVSAPPKDLRARRRLTLLAALVVPPGLLLLYQVAPTAGTWYPPCLIHWATGLHCPGCGTTRALHALLHGDWRQALAYNALTTFVLPLGLWYGLRQVIATLAGWPAPILRLNRVTLTFLFAVVILFTVARNLPFEPASRLAPHRLGETEVSTP